jgi:hypothetical protein
MSAVFPPEIIAQLIRYRRVAMAFRCTCRAYRYASTLHRRRLLMDREHTRIITKTGYVLFKSPRFLGNYTMWLFARETSIRGIKKYIQTIFHVKGVLKSLPILPYGFYRNKSIYLIYDHIDDHHLTQRKKVTGGFRRYVTRCAKSKCVNCSCRNILVILRSDCRAAMALYAIHMKWE